MKIDAHQVTFTTTHNSFTSTSLTKGYFDFQESLEQSKLNSIKDSSLLFEEKMSSDFIISELTKAILKNISTLQRRARTFSTNLQITQTQYEAMSFQTKANIQADGKNIDVNLSLTMQRSFTKNIGLNALNSWGLFADPLIISLDKNMPTLSEKSFYFDIDSDGHSEQISLLGQNSAFLALDKDSSGTINSARELFGAKSGNGFEDLKIYDEDANGWIDENDKIFHKLRVWQKSEDKDRLLALGEVGIGAIYLGNSKTPFQMNTANTNKTLGQMQRSGFFLRNDGTSGIISQIDLAIQKDEKHTLRKLLSLTEDEKIAPTNNNKEQNSIFKILMQHIKQMEVELISASTDRKKTIEETLILLKRKLKSIKI